MTLTTSAPSERQAPARLAGQRSRPTRAQPKVVLALVLAGATATVWLWWKNTPTIHGLGYWLTNAGCITGLLAGYGVVVLVALMARIPPPTS